MRRASLPLGLLLLCQSLTDALRIPIRSLPSVPASTSGTSKPYFTNPDCSNEDSSCAELYDVLDIAYSSNITLGGKSFQVLLDTGSSDIWVNGTKQPIPDALIMDNIIVSEVYSDGSNYTGPVAVADLDFHGFHVDKQYFTYATSSQNNKVIDLDIDGVLGLGFNSISKVQATVQQATGSNKAGLPFLYNLFQSNDSLPNTMSFLLGRATHTSNATQGGAFLIGETEKGYEKIHSQQVLPVIPPESVEWTFPLDTLMVNGRELDLPPPTVMGLDKPVGLIDTGTSNILVPLTAVRALYGQIAGAQTFLSSPTTEVWIIPCTVIPPSLTFVIGGQTIPIHPLDLSVIGGVYETAGGGLVTVCFGGAIATEPVAGEFDFVLGTPFLRNVYTLFNYGDKINNSSSTSLPTVQFLSITTDQAASEFNRTRTAQLERAPPASGDQIAAILNGSPDFRPVNPINPTLGGGTVNKSSSSPTRYSSFVISLAVVCLTTALSML